jgi:hypothetical protein
MEPSIFNVAGYPNPPLALLTAPLTTRAQLRSSRRERTGGVSERAHEPTFGGVDHFVAGDAKIGIRAGGRYFVST